jgi:hypothetical protein
VTWGTPIIKISNNKKSIIWEKLFDVNYDDFSDFEPLFNKIEELFSN